MKKFIALILAVLMLASLVACGDDPVIPAGPSKDEIAKNANLEDVAKALINKYAEYAKIRDTYDQYMAELDEADKISYDEFLAGQLSVMPVEKDAEWMMGLTAIPTGFSEAYCYQPMMMGQAFIGYIFRVEEGTDVEAFKKSLTDNCDPRWNICTMANTVVCENYANIVYFSMMVVQDADNPQGFTAEQKDGFYKTFVDTIEASAK